MIFLVFVFVFVFLFAICYFFFCFSLFYGIVVVLVSSKGSFSQWSFFLFVFYDFFSTSLYFEL